jgi:hypothetical protein
VSDHNEDRRKTDPFMEDVHTLVMKVSAMSETLARIEEKMIKVDDHHKTLYGINGTPGLTIAVDRLDQLEKSRNAHLSIIYTAIAGILAKVGWDVVTNHK